VGDERTLAELEGDHLALAAAPGQGRQFEAVDVVDPRRLIFSTQAPLVSSVPSS
jgi:hypothetical protein